MKPENLTENEVRPAAMFDEYLALAAADTITYFKEAEKVEINCPACYEQGSFLFDKSGFQYKECSACKTIFVSPRPVKAAFDAYYTDSPSTKFWATTFYKVTEVARREKLWKPKAELVKKIIEKYQKDFPIKNIIDIGGGYAIFDEEIRKIMDVNIVVIEPSVHLADICRKKEFNTIEKFLEDIVEGDLPKKKNCFVSFELFEHLHDPSKFMNTVYREMHKGDLFIFTTLSGMGVDIQVLGKHSKSLAPPHHLNFMNPKAITKFLMNIGFEVLEVVTPGKLDVDILYSNKHHIADHSWSNLLEYLDDSDKIDLQKAIVKLGLSSHMMITCTKKTD